MTFLRSRSHVSLPDEIIAMKKEPVSTVVDMDSDDDVEMDSSDFKRRKTLSGHTKLPEFSVNIRLRPENLVDRPFGMPPLVTRDAQKQLQELDELKATNRLHVLSNSMGRRHNMNGSTMGSTRDSFVSSRKTAPTHRKPYEEAYIRKYRNDAIGYHSVKSGDKSPGSNRDLRLMMMSTLERCKYDQPSESATSITQFDKGTACQIGLQEKSWEKYIPVINTLFGFKYDLSIQKEIANLQQKPFLYGCGTRKIITQDGPGVGDQKLKALGTGLTINCRFSQL